MSDEKPGKYQTTQPIQITNKKGHKLNGVFTLSSRGSSVAILCHGYMTNCTYPLMASLESALLPHVHVVRFDFHGCGESEGIEDWKYGGYLDEVEDLRSAVEHFRERGYTVAAICGHSRGGNVVLLYGIQYDDIPLVINVSARFDMTKGSHEKFKPEKKEALARGETITVYGDGKKHTISKEDVEIRCGIDMSAVKNIKKSRVLTVHGSNDQVVPMQDALKFHETMGDRCELVVIRDSSHIYTDCLQVGSKNVHAVEDLCRAVSHFVLHEYVEPRAKSEPRSRQ
eukprot:Filipodium_phascolosomae@DN233_c0_g1_i1.p1